MLKTLFKSSWFYLFLIVFIFSLYDYFEHISRPESIFETYALDWAFFCLAAVISLFLSMYFLSEFLKRIFRKDWLMFEALALGIWLTAYIYLLGPLFNKTFWPHSDLQFRFKPTAIFIILGIYFLTRFIIGLIIKKSLLLSNQNKKI